MEGSWTTKLTIRKFISLLLHVRLCVCVCVCVCVCLSVCLFDLLLFVQKSPRMRQWFISIEASLGSRYFVILRDTSWYTNACKLWLSLRLLGRRWMGAINGFDITDTERRTTAAVVLIEILFALRGKSTWERQEINIRVATNFFDFLHPFHCIASAEEEEEETRFGWFEWGRIINRGRFIHYLSHHADLLISYTCTYTMRRFLLNSYHTH